MSFNIYRQLDGMDCGPTCLRMIAKFYGKSLSLQTLRQKSEISKKGVSLLSISDAAENIGFRTVAAHLTFQKLKYKVPLPCIVHWNQQHFVVVYKITKRFVYVADPGKGKMVYGENEFLAHWLSYNKRGKNEGIVLLLEPTSRFYQLEDEPESGLGFNILFKYLLTYKRLLLQLFLGLVVGSILLLVFPFLTQSVVDIGVSTRNLNFIYIVLIAQLMLFAGRTSIDFLRSWILLHISTRVNVSILSDFFLKLMKLPISFFDIKRFGDIIQRIDDHKRIESFLTGSALNTLFSLLNLFILGIVLVIYNPSIFFIFLTGSVLYTTWISLFLKKRRVLDFKQFDLSAQNQSTIVQLINGMQEIKMNNCEREKRWEWEYIQGRIFNVNIQSLGLMQYQQIGGFFLNEVKNILITFYAAKSVITGNLTLGEMIAIQYMIGQMNGPIEQLIQFIKSTQDAKISLERLNEIHRLNDEEDKSHHIQMLPENNRSISIKGLFYKYPGVENDFILKNISAVMPQGKITAIVGASGSGKTTLLKLLLKFYQPQKGEVSIGDLQLDNIAHSYWRSRCGAVLQDGFIFSDTIARNIAINKDDFDLERLIHAMKVANIHDYVRSLPLGYNTKIGAEGNGLSQGQKQRILIARAVYKAPDYIFLDEATNALDANNESAILENLNTFFSGKTVIVVAHRLSTVKNADEILVLDKGEIVERGNHYELTELKGYYYELVRNQLELEK